MGKMGNKIIMKGGKKDVLGQKVSERRIETIRAKRNTDAGAKLSGIREKNGP